MGWLGYFSISLLYFLARSLAHGLHLKCHLKSAPLGDSQLTQKVAYYDNGIIVINFWGLRCSIFFADLGTYQMMKDKVRIFFLSTFLCGASAGWLYLFWQEIKLGSHYIKEPNIFILVSEIVLFSSLVGFSLLSFAYLVRRPNEQSNNDNR